MESQVLQGVISGIVTGAVVGLVVALFVEPFKKRLFRPRIRVDFGSDIDPAFVAKTPAFTETTPEHAQEYPGKYHPLGVGRAGRVLVEHSAIYVRVRAMNRRSTLATGCRAYLVRVERKSRGGKFEPVGFYDSVPLAWASRGKYGFDKYDLPRDVPLFIDVVSTRDFEPNPECPPEPRSSFRISAQFQPFRESGIGSQPGTYRFTLMVTGDNFPPVRFKLGFRWGGGWNDINAWAA